MHLTNTDPKREDSGAASKEADGAPEEIEITPAMIEAGIEAYRLWDRDDPTAWKVADIFVEMEKARRATMVAPTMAAPARICV